MTNAPWIGQLQALGVDVKFPARDLLPPGEWHHQWSPNRSQLEADPDYQARVHQFVHRHIPLADEAAAAVMSDGKRRYLLATSIVAPDGVGGWDFNRIGGRTVRRTLAVLLNESETLP